MSDVKEFMNCFDYYDAEEWASLSLGDTIKSYADAEKILDNVRGRLVEREYENELLGYPEIVLAEYNERDLIRSCHVASYIGCNYQGLEDKAQEILSNVSKINKRHILSMRNLQERNLRASEPREIDYPDIESYEEALCTWEHETILLQEPEKETVITSVLKNSKNQLAGAIRARQLKEKSLSPKPETYKDHFGNDKYKDPVLQQIADERKKIKEMDPLENKVREIEDALKFRQFLDEEDGIEDAAYNMGITGDSRTGTVSANHKETADIQKCVAKEFMEIKRDRR
ncbi:MAG: hypothetical protein E7019_06675 [Alphaproteobacteria bacterium]|nr:hypothetical protein [Alphaproteobacteria bacterium]